MGGVGLFWSETLILVLSVENTQIGWIHTRQSILHSRGPQKLKRIWTSHFQVFKCANVECSHNLLVTPHYGKPSLCPGLFKVPLCANVRVRAYPQLLMPTVHPKDLTDLRASPWQLSHSPPTFHPPLHSTRPLCPPPPLPCPSLTF